MSTRVPDWVKILMLKGEKGDRPTITTTPIDNGSEITFAYSDGTSVSVDVHNATSGDYLGLTNKPQINGNLISGNKTGQSLGLIDISRICVISGSVTVQGGAEQPVYYSESDLDNYGISDIKEWIPLGLWYGENGAEESWYAPDKIHSSYLYPSLKIVFGSTLEARFYNDTMDATTYSYKIILFRWDV